MNKTSALVQIFLICCSIKTFATTLEVGQWFPWDLVQTEFTKSLKLIEFQKNNIDIEIGDLRPQISHLNLKIQTPSPDSTFSSEDIRFFLIQSSLKIEIGALNIDQTIIRYIGGNQISIRIKVNCDPITISSDSTSLFSRAILQKNHNLLYPKVTNFDFQFNTAPIVSPVVCSGPQGIDERISRIISETIKQPDVLLNFSKNEINKIINSATEKFWNSQFYNSGVNIKPTKTSDLFESGLYVVFKVAFGKVNYITELPDENLVEPPDIESKETPHLVINNLALSRAVELESLEAKQQRVSLQSIDAFANFMQNRFAQIFLWSDLLHYSRKSDFFLDVEKIKGAKVSPSNQSYDPGQLLVWDLDLNAEGFIQSHRKGQDWRYLEWDIWQKSQLHLSLTSNKFVLENKNAQTKLNWNYGKEYRERFNPSPGVSKNLMEKVMSRSFSSLNFEIELPTLKIVSQNWTLEKIYYSKDVIKIPWVITESKP